MYKVVIFRIIVFTILVVLAVRYGSYADLASHLNAKLLLSVVAAQPFLLASIVMVTIRFAVLASTPPAPFFLTFKAILLSIGFNALLPGRLSELLKVTYLRGHAAISTSSAIATLFLERLSDVIILGLLTLVCVGLLVVDKAGMTLVLLVVALVVLAALPRLERPLSALLRHLPWHALRRAIQGFLVHVSGRVRDRQFYRAMAYGIIAWVLSWASVVVIVYFAGSIPIGLLGGLAVFVATTLGGAVPALPGGFGTFEAAGVVALKGFGYSFDEALALALALHVSQFAGSLAASFVIVITERIGVADLFHDAVQSMRAAGK